jgi:hypothetical protein
VTRHSGVPQSMNPRTMAGAACRLRRWERDGPCRASSRAVTAALVGTLPRRILLAYGTSTEVGPTAHSPLRANIRAAVKSTDTHGAVGASPAVANSAKPGPMPGQRPTPMAARLPSCAVASSPRQLRSRGQGSRTRALKGTLVPGADVRSCPRSTMSTSNPRTWLFLKTVRNKAKSRRSSTRASLPGCVAK